MRSYSAVTTKPGPVANELMLRCTISMVRIGPLALTVPPSAADQLAITAAPSAIGATLSAITLGGWRAE